MSPLDTTIDNPPIESGGASKADMVDFFADDKEVLDDKKNEEDGKVTTDMGDKTPDESGKKKELKPEGEEEEVVPEEEIKLDENIEDEKLELTDLPGRQEILKAFPDLFKKFPGLEKAYYREQQYTELFSTPAEAKEAVQRLGDYKEFENSLLSGNLESVLKSVKESDEKAFDTIGDNYLVSLAKVDEKAYHNVLTDVIKEACVNMYLAGKNANNDNLKAAAEIMHQYMFNDPKITLRNKANRGVVNNEVTEKEKELTEREQKFAQQQLDNQTNDTVNRVQNVIKSNVEKYIDPRGQMTDYVKSHAIGEVVRKIDEAIGADQRFMQLKDNLWRAAMKDGYSDASMGRIRNAILNKAKTVLPDILKSVRSNALKGLSKGDVVSRREPKKDEPIRETNSGRSTPKSSNNSKDAMRGKSTYELLSED